VSGLWVALGLAAPPEPGRVFLHVEGPGTIDLPWDVIDAGWIEVLELTEVHAILEERADRLGRGRIGKRRALKIGDRTATLEVRPDGRLTRADLQGARRQVDPDAI
jgi:hypothetical protein